MKTIFGRSVGIAAVIAIVLLMMFVGTNTARAQFCPGGITIINGTSSTLDVTFYSGVMMFSITGIVPGTGVYPSPGFVPMGIISALGNHVPIQQACQGCVRLQVSATALIICAQTCPSGPCTLAIKEVTCSPNCL